MKWTEDRKGRWVGLSAGLLLIFHGGGLGDVVLGAALIGLALVVVSRVGRGVTWG